MTWLERQQLRSYIRATAWLVPVAGLVAGWLVFRGVLAVDEATNWDIAGFTPDGARALLTTLVSAMLTFIVFAFSIMLIAVQLVSTSMSPRIIATVYRAQPTRFALALFVFTFSFSTGLLGRVTDVVPQLSLSVAVASGIVSIGAFVMLVDYFGKSLRPVSLLSRIGAEGAEVLFAVYPQVLVEDDASLAPAGLIRLGAPDRVVEMDRTSGVVVAFDVAYLTAIAERADCTIELAPQVGDFVAKRDPVFRLYGAGASAVDRAELSRAIAFGAERTFAQDPLFPFRIIVDVASKALSPAINDPTTAVLALDQLHHLLRTVGCRRLDTGIVRDGAGAVRLVYRTPNWEDFLRLAATEIRHFGASSIQVARRLRAMLENLADNLPSERVLPVIEELRYLTVAVERAFPDAWDRQMSVVGDTQGMGSPAVKSVSETARPVAQQTARPRPSAHP